MDIRRRLKANSIKLEINECEKFIERSKETIGRLKSIDVQRPDIFIPDTFNGKEVWGELLTPPKNQGTCGGCWAFASTGTLADKFNIQSLGLMNIDLSPAKLILCDKQGKELSIRHPEKNPELVAKTNIILI